jgi:capsular exopolysaccharide synthesis family protein
MTNTQNNNTQSNQYIDDDESIDLKKIITHYASKWPWMLGSVIIIFAIAWFYLRSTPPNYESTASVLVLDDKSGGLAGEMDVFSDLGITGNKSNLFNEIEVLKSRSLLEEVVKDLDLNITITQERNVLNAEICFYNTSPLQIIPAEGKESLYDKSGQFELIAHSDNEFKLTEIYKNKQGDEIENTIGSHQFGKPVDTWAGKITFEKTQAWENSQIDETFIISLSNLDAKVNALQNNLQVETINKDASVLRLKIIGTNKHRNNDILNNLIRQHEQRAITEKNQITKNTSEFIAERMKVIESELSDVEEESETFKTKNELVDVTSDAMMYMSKESEIEKALLETSIQIKLADFMLNYMQEINDYDQLLPANLGIDNEGLTEMLQAYNELVLEHNKLLQSSSVKNPTVKKIQAQLVSLQSSINQSLQNTTKSLNLKLQSLEKENQIYESKIADVPEYERQYRSIMRQQKIKETLYIYLLEKREENEIAMASTIGNIKVIDLAYSTQNPVSPKKNIIYLAALLLGLALPVGIIYIRDLLDNTVNGIEDLEALNIPIAGVIPESKSKKKSDLTHVFKTTKNTPQKNAFQMLRSNIGFLLPDKEDNKGQIIFISSTISSEGKTFMSINLADELTINNQNVLIIGLDLRAPKITEYLNMPATNGISDYVINKALSIDDIIIPSEDNSNLSYIISGNIPPNPAEIMMNKRLVDLLTKVREKFDYIIVDNPPLAMVVDTLSVIEHADLVLYVIRDRYLDKKALELPVKLRKDKKIHNLATILNFARFQSSSYGIYGYGYGYGEKQDNAPIKRLLNRLKKSI